VRERQRDGGKKEREGATEHHRLNASENASQIARETRTNRLAIK